MGSNRRLDGWTSVTRVIEDLGKAEGNRSSAEAGHDAGDHLAQRIEMISAFQGHGESAPAEASREGCAPGHEFEVSRGRQDERREWVAVVRIDPEAHEDQIRPELLDDRLDDPVMSGEVRSVPTPRREWDIHRESAAFSRPDVLGGTRARVDAVLVHGEIQDGRAVGEDVARSVPVMGVVVQDGDAPSLGHLVRGRDSDVVQVAEAASVVGARVMARRSYESDRRSAFPHGGSRPLKDRPRREAREVERPRVHGGLGIEQPLAEVLEIFDIRFPMDPLHFRDRRKGRLLDVGEKAGSFQVGNDRPEPIRPLHMEGRGYVIEEPRIVDEHGRGRAGADFKASSRRFWAFQTILSRLKITPRNI